MNEIDTARLLVETDRYLVWQRSTLRAMRLSAAIQRADATMTALAHALLVFCVLAVLYGLDTSLRIVPPALFLGAWLVALCRWLWRYVQAIRAGRVADRLLREMR